MRSRFVLVRPTRAYWEIGGAGGPAGGTGGGAEAVTAGAAGGGADGTAGGSGGPPGTGAVAGGTGSARNTVVSPLPDSLGATILADSGLASPDGLESWALPSSPFAVS